METIVTTAQWLEKEHGIPACVWPPTDAEAVMISPAKGGAFWKEGPDKTSKFIVLPEPHCTRLQETCTNLHNNVLDDYGDCYPIVPFDKLFHKKELLLKRKALLNMGGTDV